MGILIDCCFNGGISGASGLAQLRNWILWMKHFSLTLS